MTEPPGSAPDPARMSIAVPTYRRPVELANLLRLVLSQLGDLPTDDVRILVIDNDPDQSGRPVVAAIGSAAVSYLQERRPGVAAVRNRALREAWSDDVLIFIDDDQLPDDGWLRGLVSAWRFSGEAVAGPVVSEVPQDADGWIRNGGFFDRSYRNSLVTGDEIDEVATTNLLLDMRAIRSRGLLFDERFGLSGGEDSLFTRTLTRSGARIIWAAEARVLERVPANRLSRSWVSRRAISSGNGVARVRLALEPSANGRLRTRMSLMTAGLARCGGGAIGAVGGMLRRSDATRGRSTRTMLRGVGMFLGSLGITYLEYAREGRRWQFGSGS
ncbi:glycosyltransferase family 2 protein [Microlunatus endophyticus]|nr:glycosyltransferase [Microlunatus endophyticus]